MIGASPGRWGTSALSGYLIIRPAAARREAASVRGITFGEIRYLEFVLVDSP